MKRLLTWTFAAVFVLPVLLVAGGPSGAEQASGFTARGGGGDEAQVAAAPPDLRPVFIDAARRFVLPPALLVAIAEVGGDGRSLTGLTASEWTRFGHGDPADPPEAFAAAARLLLSAGAAGDGGWDAAKGLAGYTAVADRVDEVLARAADYGYRYRPDGPPLDPDRYVFPVTGEHVSYGPLHHDYPATDIFTAIGTPVVAATRSVVLRLSRTEVGKGGITVTLRGEDGWRYYYAHLSRLADTVRPGDVVEVGTLLGWSGNTGNARTTAPHLHFGISLYGQTAGEISPYPYLQTWPREAS